MIEPITAARIAQALAGRRIGARWVAKCPGHEDRSPSLSISDKNGRVLLHCFSGCEQQAVIDALRARGLWPERESTGKLPRPRDPDRWADLNRAEYWRQSVQVLADQLLEDLPLVAPDRRALTTLVRVLRDPSPDVLLAAYRDWRAADAALTAGLVFSGRLREARLQRRLAKWVVSKEMTGQ